MTRRAPSTLPSLMIASVQDDLTPRIKLAIASNCNARASPTPIVSAQCHGPTHLKAHAEARICMCRGAMPIHCFFFFMAYAQNDRMDNIFSIEEARSLFMQLNAFKLSEKSWTVSALQKQPYQANWQSG
mmetsp:Transcript_96159/g.161631  ORF Transcript_96159/g.161631 Transcript_96159/m.161631 type:complete len:129 (+) Transcript_96159:404-790(+)